VFDIFRKREVCRFGLERVSRLDPCSGGGAATGALTAGLTPVEPVGMRTIAPQSVHRTVDPTERSVTSSFVLQRGHFSSLAKADSL
jgi:hypothetical protein